MIECYGYTAFGQAQSRTGSTVNPYQYAGQQLDAVSGLYDMRARYYNPNDSHFLSQDTASIDYTNPVELNRYNYTNNEPIDYRDPSGYTQATTLGGVKGVAGGGDLGEYASILTTINLAVGSLIAVGLLTNCKAQYAVSILLAAFREDPSLLLMETFVEPDCMLPILKFSLAQYPKIGLHISIAQIQGWPMLLTYLGPNAGNANRNSACTSARRRQLRPLSCDEYPFNSTAEGGASASTTGVPLGENQSQGGTISAFYRGSNRQSRALIAGDWFAVIVTP